MFLIVIGHKWTFQKAMCFFVAQASPDLFSGPEEREPGGRGRSARLPGLDAAQRRGRRHFRVLEPRGEGRGVRHFVLRRQLDEGAHQRVRRQPGDRVPAKGAAQVREY